MSLILRCGKHITHRLHIIWFRKSNFQFINWEDWWAGQHLKPDDILSKTHLCAVCSSVASSWPVGHYWKELKCWEKFTIPSQPNPYSITEPTWWIMHTNLEMKQPLLCALEDFQRDMSYLGAPLFWSFRRNIWKNASLSLIRYVYRVFGIPQQVCPTMFFISTWCGACKSIKEIQKSWWCFELPAK